VGWARSQVIVARDVCEARPWMAMPQYVVDDSPRLLVTYVPEGAQLGYLPESDHPWYPQAAWEGNGALQLRRPGDRYSVIHFWRGDQGAFTCWYVNIEAPFHRTAIGFDYADQELDIVVLPDGSWFFKDWEMLDEHMARGRYTEAQVADIRAEGLRIGAELDARTQWWDDRWISWAPDPAWTAPTLPEGWRDIPV
jgi:hypothetical protein